MSEWPKRMTFRGPRGQIAVETHHYHCDREMVRSVLSAQAHDGEFYLPVREVECTCAAVTLIDKTKAEFWERTGFATKDAELIARLLRSE